MKLQERVLDSYIRKMGNIDEMQFGFVPGRSTTDSPGALDKNGLEVKKNSRKQIFSRKLHEGAYSSTPTILYHCLCRRFYNSRWRPAAILDLWNS